MKKHSLSIPSGTAYGIIGGGKAASHVARYFSLLGIPFLRWSRKNARKTGKPPEQALKNCEIILVLIKDSAIEDFIRRHPSIGGGKYVHFSGSLVTPLAAGAHPLAAFGPRLFKLPQYEEIPFITEKGGTPFKAIFPRLKNTYYEIPKELKPFYHSLCVMSGNFTTILWRKLFTEFDRTFGIPPKAAAQYLKCVCGNIEKDRKNALTGPLARKDAATIYSNLNALSDDPFRKIYRAFAETFAPECLTVTKS